MGSDMKDQATLHTQVIHLENKKIFFQSLFDGRQNGWYITVTGKHVYGPFEDRQVAQQILEGLLQRIRDDAKLNDQEQQPWPTDASQLMRHA